MSSVTPSSVPPRLTRFLEAGQTALLKQGRIGLEKECLRVNAAGKLSQGPHPDALGSALTNPYITTDYSEALLELITPPCSRMSEALNFLRDAQQFVYHHINDELLWATSMPCVVAGDPHIPVAYYGNSNAGRMKTVYRLGLGHRYGRTMQVIAGVHFNYSFSDDFWAAFQTHEGESGALRDFTDARYFGLLRNLQRVGWIVPYLFGASPAVCKSFLHGKDSTLAEFDANTFYEPYATSLRMGDIGYQNNKESESGIKADYDSLETYTESLIQAVTTPCPEYARIGVKVDGEYRQLNANILQIENEYYSTVRPKQPPLPGEMPIMALKRRGVQYIELRSLDVNAFHPLGIDQTQLYFLEALMLYGLFETSPPISAAERIEIDANEMSVAHRGREPGLSLQRQGRSVPLQSWALELCDALQPLCEALDRDEQGSPYRDSLAQQRAAIEDPERTPSAAMLAEMRDRGEGFFAFAQRMSQQHYRYFHELPGSAEVEDIFGAEATASLQRQQAIEAADDLSFDDYLAKYFGQCCRDEETA